MLFKGCLSRGLSMNISLTRPSSQCRQIHAFCFENVSFFASGSGQRNLFATIPHQQIKLSASVPVRQTCFWDKFEPWLCGSNLGRGCQGLGGAAPRWHYHGNIAISQGLKPLTTTAQIGPTQPQLKFAPNSSSTRPAPSNLIKFCGVGS